ncbi:thermonuclease family protein [Mesorhizobium sp. KR2-14]|uniref:thermonuclease family protein n=1 Tax=Mesorhizobium sp. KR2-14 TaxID=3156610 RepID=UPI0032B3AAAA
MAALLQRCSTLVVIAGVGLGASVACAEPILGRASVIDGDTIEIHGQRIRFNGIDAPESKQLCLDAQGKKYRCGQKASFALAGFLEGRQPTTCIEVDRDRYRRVVAVCTAGGVDIAEWMVKQGHALDWPEYSNGAYASAQEAARGGKRGMWAGSFALPWEWRRHSDAAPLISGAGF